MYFTPIIMTKENAGMHIKKDIMILRNQKEVKIIDTPFSFG